MPSFTARLATLAQLGCLLWLISSVRDLVFPQLCFLPSFLRSSGMHSCPRDGHSSPLLLLLRVWPTGACYVRRHGIVSFNRPTVDAALDRGFSRSLSFSHSLGTARLSSTLTSFSHSAPGDFGFLSHGPSVSSLASERDTLSDELARNRKVESRSVHCFGHRSFAREEERSILDFARLRKYFFPPAKLAVN